MKRALVLVVMALLFISIARSRAAATLAAGDRSSPVITSVVPVEPARNTRPQTLTVNGSDFQSGLSLAVKNPGGQSTIVRGKDVLQQRPTSFQVHLLIDVKGIYSLIVTNPDGGASAAFDVAVK